MAEHRVARRSDRYETTAEYVRAALDYDPETGIFHWKRRADRGLGWNTKFAGKRTGYTDVAGYVYIALRTIGRPDKTMAHAAHRIAWLYMTGEWPENYIDHINGVRHDNRFANLRKATNSENIANCKIHKDNTSGFKGVTWCKSRQKWQAQMKVHRAYYMIGRYDTAEEAHKAYCEAATRLRGEFARFK